MERKQASALAVRCQRFVQYAVVVALGSTMAACAQSGSVTSRQVTVAGISDVAATARIAAGATGCEASEVTVFACKLQGSHDRVALCAGQGAATGVLYFVRTGNRPEVFPADRRGTGHFMTTHVFSTGATGIRTHSFNGSSRRHVLYSISGTGIEEQGLFSMPKESSKPDRQELCDPATQQDSGWELAESWKSDPIIEAHGLPHL